MKYSRATSPTAASRRTSPLARRPRRRPSSLTASSPWHRHTAAIPLAVWRDPAGTGGRPRDGIAISAIMLLYLLTALAGIALAGESATQGRFSRLVDSSPPPLASTTAAPRTFSLNFSVGGITRYRFHQEAVNSFDFGSEGEGPSAHDAALDATLRIETTGDEKGFLVLELPSGLMATGMTAGGEVDPGASAMQMFAYVLLLLPPGAIDVGTSVTIPLSVSVATFGSVLPLEGEARIKLSGFHRMGDLTVARFEREVQMDRLRVPDGLGGQHEATVVGRGISYFDIAGRRFVAGSGTVRMDLASTRQETTTEVDVAKAELRGQAPPTVGDPKAVRRAVSSENYWRIELQDADL